MKYNDLNEDVLNSIIKFSYKEIEIYKKKKQSKSKALVNIASFIKEEVKKNENK